MEDSFLVLAYLSAKEVMLKNLKFGGFAGALTLTCLYSHSQQLNN